MNVTPRPFLYRCPVRFDCLECSRIDFLSRTSECSFSQRPHGALFHRYDTVRLARLLPSELFVFAFLHSGSSLRPSLLLSVSSPYPLPLLRQPRCCCDLPCCPAYHQVDSLVHSDLLCALGRHIGHARPFTPCARCFVALHHAVSTWYLLHALCLSFLIDPDSAHLS
jgi:hypothetical protein